MSRPLRTVIIGAGQRGRHVYGAWALQNPDAMSIVGVVDPLDERRAAVVAEHRVVDGFVKLDDFLRSGIGADAVIIASPDREHERAAVSCIEAGYHVLIEKPVAHTFDGVRAIAEAADRTDRVVAVAHVLRYTEFFQVLRDVIRSGRLGDLVMVTHRENVAAWHMAHSFVRGNWAIAAGSSPMIVAKCCHDFDILTWNLDSPIASLTSNGSLLEFTPDRSPVGATERCTSPCPVTDCPYDARRIYLDQANSGWPVHVITDDPSHEGRMAALEQGPYGRCVYTAGSDVVDHQVVSMDLKSGATAVLIMHGHSHEEQRTMRYDGTRATLRATFGARQVVEVIDHVTGETESIPIAIHGGGHGGGDAAMLAAFVDAARTGRDILATPSNALAAYELAFAAEQARLTGDRVVVREFSV